MSATFFYPTFTNVFFYFLHVFYVFNAFYFHLNVYYIYGTSCTLTRQYNYPLTLTLTLYAFTATQHKCNNISTTSFASRKAHRPM